MQITGLKKEYVEDLDYFLEYAESKRGKGNEEEYPEEAIHLDFYHNHSKDELIGFVNDYVYNRKVNNDYDFYYMLKCVIKYMNGFEDSHTRINIEDNNWFPISFKVIENSVFIDKCLDEKLLRKKIKSINGVDIETIISEISDCTSYGTIGWLLFTIEGSLINRNDLLSLPSINTDSKKIVYETEDNEKIEFEVDKNYDEEMSSSPRNTNQYRIIDNMLVFRYPACKPKCEPDIKLINSLIEEKNIEKFILDIRRNTGGNSEIIKDLIEYLSNSKLELFTLVDRGVFSSGKFAAVDMKRIGSKIVGEEIGTPLNYFGYVSGNAYTPNSNINFHFAKVYWYCENDIVRGIFTKEELHKQSKEFFEPKYLPIDIPITITEEEYTGSFDDVFFSKCIETIEKQANHVK